MDFSVSFTAIRVTLAETSECVGHLHAFYTQYKSEAIRIYTQGKKAKKKCELSVQIAFLELIISFYVIHLSPVIVCQSNAVAARYEVECKFCLGESLLCTKKRGGRGAGFTFTITVMIQSSLIIIPLPGMSAPIESRLHAAHTKQLLGRPGYSASGPVIYTMRSLTLSASVSR